MALNSLRGNLRRIPLVSAARLVTWLLGEIPAVRTESWLELGGKKPEQLYNIPF
jgi:hypothetical protein